MILSRGRNYLFLHAPPKTGGGTALSLALENRAMKDDILLGDTPPKAVRRRGGRVKGGVNSAGRLWKHSMLTDLYGLITPEEVDKLFIFTLVRNPPWDRMVSYYHWLQTQTFDHPAVALAKALDFADFIAHPQTLAAMRFAPPYGRYVRDREGGRERCNLFLRLEQVDADLAALEDHLAFASARCNASMPPNATATIAAIMMTRPAPLWPRSAPRTFPASITVSVKDFRHQR